MSQVSLSFHPPCNACQRHPLLLPHSKDSFYSIPFLCCQAKIYAIGLLYTLISRTSIRRDVQAATGVSKLESKVRGAPTVYAVPADARRRAATRHHRRRSSRSRKPSRSARRTLSSRRRTRSTCRSTRSSTRVPPCLALWFLRACADLAPAPAQTDIDTAYHPASKSGGLRSPQFRDTQGSMHKAYDSYDGHVVREAHELGGDEDDEDAHSAASVTLNGTQGSGGYASDTRLHKPHGPEH